MNTGIIKTTNNNERGKNRRELNKETYKNKTLL